MKIIKVSHLTRPDGICDYKGLDIEKFIPGSQMYAHDSSSCMIQTTEEVEIVHEDLEEVSLNEYNDYKEQIISSRPKTEVELLQERLAQAEEDNRTNEQAILELSTIIGGML